MAGGNRPDVASYPVISGYYMSSITMVGAGPAPHRPTSGIGALIHYDWARAIFFGFKRDKITTPKPGELRIFHSTAQSGKQPKATVTVPSDYKVLSGGGQLQWPGELPYRLVSQRCPNLGGGAESHWQSSGALLTESYPNPQKAGYWVASTKSHLAGDSITITAYAIGIKALGRVVGPTAEI
jgi:hypothetical protein